MNKAYMMLQIFGVILSDIMLLYIHNCEAYFLARKISEQKSLI